MDTDFNASDANNYKIQISDEGETISVYLGEQIVGKILLEYKSDNITGYPGGEKEIYHIINLSLDGCKGIGLGQACLEFHKEIYGLPITAGQDRMVHGESEDGSHLTGDGVGFVSAMREKHIIEN